MLLELQRNSFVLSTADCYGAGTQEARGSSAVCYQEGASDLKGPR